MVCIEYLAIYKPSLAEVDTGWMTKQEHPPLKTRFVLTGQADAASKTVEGYLEVELDDDWKTTGVFPVKAVLPPLIGVSRPILKT